MSGTGITVQKAFQNLLSLFICVAGRFAEVGSIPFQAQYKYQLQNLLPKGLGILLGYELLLELRSCSSEHKNNYRLPLTLQFL